MGAYLTHDEDLGGPWWAPGSCNGLQIISEDEHVRGSGVEDGQQFVVVVIPWEAQSSEVLSQIIRDGDLNARTTSHLLELRLHHTPSCLS